MTMRSTLTLVGDNTIPGNKIPEKLQKLIPTIIKRCRDFGLDFYEPVIEKLTFDEMSEIASYGGFPIRYPHYSFGMEYEELSKGYEYGFSKIFELVINTNPSYLYCLDSNSILEDVLVISHAIGHSHFFKNNIFFAPTNENMMNIMANHAMRIEKYMSRWGQDNVTDFIDYVLRIETLIDYKSAWSKRSIKDVIVSDKRTYRNPRRLPVEKDFMDSWVNTKDYIKKEHERIEKEDAAEYLNLFNKPTKDIFGYLKDHAPLKPWQQDIISMLYEESLYFAPQRMTKVCNEGFASWVDHKLMSAEGLVSLGQDGDDVGIVEYALHKTAVLGGKYSMNPYNMGYQLLMDIEKRWNEGRFGSEYENCKNMKEKLEWDKKLGLGKEKVFEVAKYYDDLTLIMEFFTEEFSREHEFFEWKKYGDEYKIASRDFKAIKNKLLDRHTNSGLPDIRLVDPNHKNKRWFLLEHNYTGQPLFEPWIAHVMNAIYAIWDNNVILTTQKNDKEVVYVCNGVDEKDVHIFNREEYDGIN